MNKLAKNLADGMNLPFDPAYNYIHNEEPQKINRPLGRAIADQEADEITKWGNGLIFSFAGHDTTGHSMAFFCYEMAKRPDYQIKSQDEIDTFFSRRLFIEM